MQITGSIARKWKDDLNALYPDAYDRYKPFSDSYLTAYAFDGEKLLGAVRVISEGVETALLVDLAGTDDAVKSELLAYLETQLNNRRVMVYGTRADLDFWEEHGYGRCKNAWTYFREGFAEQDFLAPGYSYSNESTSVRPPKQLISEKPELQLQSGFAEESAEEVNTLLTRAFWGHPHDINKTIAAFSASQYVLSAYLDGKLVGIARAVSDGEQYATILNVAVDPDYQGLSIGKEIVLKLSERIAAEVIVLNTHPGAVGFYNRLTQYRRNRYVFEKQIRADAPAQPAPPWMDAMFTPKGFRFPDEQT